MPVKGCPFLGSDNVIANSCRNAITPIGFDSWSGESSINEQSTTIYAIRGNIATSDIELVSPCNTYESQWTRSEPELKKNAYRYVGDFCKDWCC